MRLIMSGDRDWVRKDVVLRVLATLPKNAVIIHGRARGLDTIAAECALELGMPIDKPPTTTDLKNPEHLGGYPAQWQKYYKGAGPVRNLQMIQEGKADQVYAWHDDVWSSKGTKNMIDQAIHYHLPVYLFTSDGCKHSVSLDHGELLLHFEQLGVFAKHPWTNTHYQIITKQDLRYKQRSFINEMSEMR